MLTAIVLKRYWYAYMYMPSHKEMQKNTQYTQKSKKGEKKKLFIPTFQVR